MEEYLNEFPEILALREKRRELRNANDHLQNQFQSDVRQFSKSLKNDLNLMDSKKLFEKRNNGKSE